MRLTGVTAGHIDASRYILCAYYDTPRRRLVSTPRIIARPIASFVLSAMPAVLLLLVSLLFWRAGAPLAVCECAFLVLVFAIYYLAPNTTNANFTSSGLLALFSLSKSVVSSAGFALLDGADLPASGISALKKSYGKRLANKTIILIGNVGTGSRVCVGCPKGDEELRALAERIAGADGYVYSHRKKYIRVDSAVKTELGYVQFHLRTQKDTRLSDDSIERVIERIAQALSQKEL